MSVRFTGCVLAAVLLSASGTARPISMRADEATSERIPSAAESTVWNLLLPPAKGARPDPGEIAQKIARLGRDAIAPSIGILLGLVPEPESETAPHPDAVEARREILLGALRRLPASAVLEELRQHASEDKSVDERLLVVHILGEIGGGPALDLLLGIVTRLDPIQWMRTYVQEVIEGAIATVLQRDAGQLKRVAVALAGSDARCGPILVRALGRAELPAALPVLVRALGRDVELDLAVAQELVHIVSNSFGELSNEDMGRLRDLLDATDARLVRGGAAALARLGDEESCGRLVALLSDDDALTASTAHWGLKQLSGVDLPADAEAWARWHEREREWFDSAFPALSEAIAAGDADGLMSPATDALTHPLFKHRIAAALTPLLESDNAILGRLACSVLGQLGSRSCIPRLVACLEAEDDALRALAWNALRSITGMQLPQDAKSWNVLLVQ